MASKSPADPEVTRPLSPSAFRGGSPRKLSVNVHFEGEVSAPSPTDSGHGSPAVESGRRSSTVTSPRGSPRPLDAPDDAKRRQSVILRSCPPIEREGVTELAVDEIVLSDKKTELLRWSLYLARESLAVKVFGRTYGTYNAVVSPLNIIPPRGRLRRTLIRVVDHEVFRALVFVLIGLNTVCLCLDSRRWKGTFMRDFLRVADLVFLGIFTGEAMIKIGAMGFVMNNYSYLRQPRNVCDLMVLLVSLPVLVVEDFDAEKANLTPLRLSRFIRPVALLTKSESIRRVLFTILMTVPHLFNVFFLVFFLLWTFGLLGMQIWMGAFHYRCYWRNGTDAWSLVLNDTRPCGSGSIGRSCADNGLDLGLEQLCMRDDSVFKTSAYNYDNMFHAVVTAFKIITLDGWQEDMERAQDATGYMSWLYFVALTMLGSYFSLQLILALLTSNYADTKAHVTVPRIPPLHNATGACVLGGTLLHCMYYCGYGVLVKWDPQVACTRVLDVETTEEYLFRKCQVLALDRVRKHEKEVALKRQKDGYGPTQEELVTEIEESEESESEGEAHRSSPGGWRGLWGSYTPGQSTTMRSRSRSRSKSRSRSRSKERWRSRSRSPARVESSLVRSRSRSPARVAGPLRSPSPARGCESVDEGGSQETPEP
eukprot:Hpha_TRINITY_DN1921_c0_g2::TRINITY_DN1921_c0_g2_i1::g.31125::m.31125